MEILNQLLPEAIVNNIRKYHSHPIADVINEILIDNYYINECQRYKRNTGRDLPFVKFMFQTQWEWYLPDETYTVAYNAYCA